MQVTIGIPSGSHAKTQAEHLRSLLRSRGVDAIVSTYTNRAEGYRAYWSEHPEGLWLTHVADDAQRPEAAQLQACLARTEVREVLVALEEDIHLENFSRDFRIAVMDDRAAFLLNHYAPQSKVQRLVQAPEHWAAWLHEGRVEGILAPLHLVQVAGLAGHIKQKLNPTSFLPRPGEGIWGVYTQATPLPVTWSGIHHQDTYDAWRCEYAFSQELPSGLLPMGYATVQQGELTFWGGACNAGQAPTRQQAGGAVASAEALGRRLARSLFATV